MEEIEKTIALYGLLVMVFTLSVTVISSLLMKTSILLMMRSHLNHKMEMLVNQITNDLLGPEVGSTTYFVNGGWIQVEQITKEQFATLGDYNICVLYKAEKVVVTLTLKKKMIYSKCVDLVAGN